MIANELRISFAKSETKSQIGHWFAEFYSIEDALGPIFQRPDTFTPSMI